MNKTLKKTFWWSFAVYFGVVTFTRFFSFPELDDISRLFYASPFCEFWDEYIAGRMRFLKTQICYLTKEEVVELLKSNPQDDINHFQSIAATGKEYVAIRMQANSGSVYGTLKCYFLGFPFPLVFQVWVPFTSTVKQYAHEGPGYRNFLILPLPANLDSQESNCISFCWKNYW
ncbi:MAG: hypothetical protein K1X28_05125 [Parachlamydiales bacterium]|nr:hypothetical protein [Parachlamydiales bacterium]